MTLGKELLTAWILLSTFLRISRFSASVGMVQGGMSGENVRGHLASCVSLGSASMDSSSDDDTPLVALKNGQNRLGTQSGKVNARNANGKRTLHNDSDASSPERPLVCLHHLL